MTHFDHAARLAVLAIAGQLVAYLISVLLARQLGIDGFEAYAVACAAFTLMVSIAPRGIEKYTLRLLPALYDRADWGAAKGLIAFGRRRTLYASLIGGSAVVLGVTLDHSLPSATRLAIVVSCLSLPTGALAHHGVEVLSANGRDLRATAIFRLAVPSLTLACVALLIYQPLELTGAMAVGCWGFSWALALAIMAVEVRRTTPREVSRAKASEDSSSWAAGARPFMIYRISLALLAQAGVIAVDRLHPSAAAVGAYAAAMGTTSLAIVLATATNRAYSRRLSVLLDRRDYAGVLELRRERLRWLLPAIAVFLVVVFAFGRELLALFHPKFVEEGVTALRLLAISTAFSVLFALAPTYLKYRQHNRATLKIVAAASGAQILLLLLLVPHLGATGAATAYTLSMSTMYLVFARMAHKELLQLNAQHEDVG